jgi:phosphoglycerate dehydrogenase-like enzyme
VKLVIKKLDNDGRLSLVPGFLASAWDIEVADQDDYAAFERALRDADALITMSWRGNVPPAPRLKLLQLPGAGLDEIDLSKVMAGTTVCNCFEHEIGIAEYVMGALLDWMINFRELDAHLRSGSWRGSHLCGPRHGELFGKTLGIVGYGRIGRELAIRARAFGMTLRVVSRTPREGDAVVGRVDDLSKLDALLAEADFIVVTLPLSDTTRGLIDAEAFGRMKRTAVIVNVSRGAIIEEQALYVALKSRRIAGAVIDVWYRYPTPEKPEGQPASLPFHELDNILMTPHASAWTDGLLPRRSRAIAENLDRLAAGRPLLNVVRGPLETPALANAI